MDEIFNKIIAKTYTQYDLKRRLNLLKNVMTKEYFAHDIQSQPVEERDQKWLTEIMPFLKLTKENFSDTFAALEEKAQNIHSLIIFVPVLLPDTEIDTLGEKIRIDYGNNFVIDIRLDPGLIGGAALAWGGIYKDYSIKERIKEKKESIIETFQKYIR